MKLSVSNIIWKKGKENFESFLEYIVKDNINAVELSLNSVFPEPLDMSENDFIWLVNLLEKYNVSVSALHSLTYTRPDLELFNSAIKRDELINYLCYYIEIARKIKTKNLVFGSPKARKTYGQGNEKEIFIDFLEKIDLNSGGVNFNLEPLPKNYCDYLNTFLDGVKILEENNFKNIFLQVDIRSIIENIEEVKKIFEHQKYIKHVHIGEPNLKMPSVQYGNFHKLLNDSLWKMNYEGYLSIEVINHEQKEFINYLRKTIIEVKKYYG